MNRPLANAGGFFSLVRLNICLLGYTNLVPVLVLYSYVTNLTKVTKQMPTCKSKRFEMSPAFIIVWHADVSTGFWEPGLGRPLLFKPISIQIDLDFWNPTPRILTSKR